MEERLASYVETARSPIELSRLCRSLLDEHSHVTTPEVQANWTLPDVLTWDEDRITRPAARLSELRDVGISIVADLTAAGLDPDIPGIPEAAALAGLNIMTAVGLHVLSGIRRPSCSSDPDRTPH